MIYLFDDNEGSQLQLNYSSDILSVLGSHTGLVKHYDSFPGEGALRQMLKSASLIGIHGSFPPFDMNDLVCQLARENGTPLVIFSGGLFETTWKETDGFIEVMMNKQLFYTNLPYFLHDFGKTKNPALLKDLVYGRYYAFERSRAIQDSLARYLSTVSGSFSYEEAFGGGSKQYDELWSLFELAYGEEHESRFSDFDDLAIDEDYGPKEIFGRVNDLVKIIKGKHGK